jgi:hypothetical protein
MRNWRSFLKLILVPAIAWVGVSAESAQADLTGNVNLFLGAKGLDEDDWAPVEDQGELAVEFDFRERTWPLNVVVGLRGAHDEENLGGGTIESSTSELSLGVRKIWDSAVYIRPFIGVGLALIGAEQKTPAGTSSSDGAPGIWLGGGVYWALTPNFNLGFDLRVSGAEVTVAGVDRQAGGAHFGILFGYHF